MRCQHPKWRVSLLQHSVCPRAVVLVKDSSCQGREGGEHSLYLPCLDSSILSLWQSTHPAGPDQPWALLTLPRGSNNSTKDRGFDSCLPATGACSCRVSTGTWAGEKHSLGAQHMQGEGSHQPNKMPQGDNHISLMNTSKQRLG